jgi:glycosyltransferase involved in cell wall biosynthesis
MNVLFICGAGYVSGREIISLAQAEGLRDRGVNVLFIVSKWNNGDFTNRLRDKGIPYVVLPVGFISKTLRLGPLLMTLDQLLWLPVLLMRYKRLCKQFKPDAIIHTNFHHAILLRGQMQDSRDYYIVHETIPTSPFYRRVVRYISRGLRSYIPVSDFVGRNLSGLGVPATQIKVIKNGILLPTITVESISEHDGVNLGIVGQVIECKGHEDVLKTLACLKEEGLLPKLLIFGACSESYRQKLDGMISNLGLIPQVEWCGFERDQRKIYSRLDVCLVMSKHSDPFPTSALEAAAHAMPVIASSQGGLPEIVADGKTGFICEHGNIQAIAKAIRKLGDRNLRGEMAIAARARAESLFQRERMISELHGFLSLTR